MKMHCRWEYRRAFKWPVLYSGSQFNVAVAALFADGNAPQRVMDVAAAQAPKRRKLPRG